MQGADSSRPRLGRPHLTEQEVSSQKWLLPLFHGGFRSWKRPASASCVQTHWLKALQLLGWRPSSHLRAEHRRLENYTPVCDAAAPHSAFTHRLSDTLQSWGKARGLHLNTPWDTGREVHCLLWFFIMTWKQVIEQLGSETAELGYEATAEESH